MTRNPPQYGQKKAPRAPYAPRKASPPTESSLAVAVAEALTWSLPKDAVWTAWDNSNAGEVEGYRKKRMGVRPGWPDLGVFWRGVVVLVELKRPRQGALSAAQKLLHPRLIEACFPVTVCRSVDDVLLAIRGAGIPLISGRT